MESKDTSIICTSVDSNYTLVNILHSMNRMHILTPLRVQGSIRQNGRFSTMKNQVNQVCSQEGSDKLRLCGLPSRKKLNQNQEITDSRLE